MKTCFYPVLIFALCVSTVYADSSTDTITGGRLYDKWWVDTDLPKPQETHPVYPVNGKKKGSATWRCKECHGWDYRGSDGAYKKGSHFTGIKGIRNQSGKDQKSIIKILTDNQHQYGIKLSDNELQALAIFVSRGQMDMSRYIDSDSKMVKGDSKKGKPLYADNCQACHGKKGDALNLSNKKGKTLSVGGVSNKNPWETLHKIRFGHPGAVMDMEKMHSSNMRMFDRHKMGMPMWQAMPPMFDKLSESEQVDLLTYLQTLPK